MSREIRFRGKRIDNSEWVYGYFTKNHKTGKCYITTQSESGGAKPHQVIPETIGQFTGLKDKNGKEIYEGDIIQDERGKKYLIKWGINSNGFIAKTNEAHCNVYSSYHLSFKTQVIGNVYEDGELLDS